MLAGLLAPMGALGDRVGRRRLLLVGSTGFAAVSALAAFAPTGEVLVAARVVQAGGGKLVTDEDITGERAIDDLMPMLTDPDLALAMGRRARAAGHGEADEKLARIVMEVARR